MSVCEVTETITLAGGSTIELQGGSQRTIAGGSGMWRAATGTLTVASNEDFALWTKRFEIWLEDRRVGAPAETRRAPPA